MRYERTSRLLHELMLSHADGSYLKLLHGLSRVKLLICDDWLRDPLTLAQARDLLEILDDRYGRSSTLVATQIPVEEWHARIPDPTLADAVLDRLVHNAYRLELKGMMASPAPPASRQDGLHEPDRVVTIARNGCAASIGSGVRHHRNAHAPLLCRKRG